MAPFGFTYGGSYTSQSPNAAMLSCINWYVEQMEEQANDKAVLYPTGGLLLFSDLVDTPVRGEITVNDRTFVVAGSRFYEIDSLGVKTERGVLANDSKVVSMAGGTSQILIASAGLVYVYDFSSGLIASTTLNSGGDDGIASSGLNVGGTGYLVGDTFSVATGNVDAIGMVDNITGAGVVTAYHLTNIGSGYSVGAGVATNTISGGGSGLSINITSVGGGYAVGDTGTIDGGGVPATYQVSTVDGNGNVLTYVISTPGSGYAVVSGATTTDGGAQPGVGRGFVIDITGITSADSFTVLPAGVMLGPISFVGYCDGFFIALLRDSNQFQISQPLNALVWDPADTAKVSVFTGNVLSMIVDHREVWFFGERQTQVYTNTGNALFPFEVIPGAFIEAGIFAPNSVVQLDNSLFWLGGDSRGAGVGWRASGYTPTRITNHSVEFAWQGYLKQFGPTGLNTAVAYSFQDQGHSFWQIYFPVPNKTWVYDVATGFWHERGAWVENSGIFVAHHSQVHTFNFGKHLVGDWASGKVYDMSIAYYDDDGQPIRRVRRAPHIAQEQKYAFHSMLQVFLESGLGPQPPLTGPPVTGGVGFPFTIMLDSGSNFWNMGVDDTGLLMTTLVGAGPGLIIHINDSIIAGQSWLLGADAGGLLLVTSVTFNASYPKSVFLSSTSSGLHFTVTVQAGLLQTDGPTLPARDPMINLRWSDDSHTWSNLYAIGAGQAGEYKKRAIWRRLGRSRDRVYEVSVSDPIPWRLVDAYIEVTSGDGS